MTDGVERGDSGPSRNMHTLVLAAAVGRDVSSESFLRQFGSQDSVGLSARVFEIRRRIVVMEFRRMAQSAEDVLGAAVRDVLTAYPAAEFIDPADADTVADLMVDVDTGQPPSDGDLDRILRCYSPSAETVLLAADGIDGLVESMLPEGPQRCGALRFVEAEVFNVLRALRLVQLQSVDGRTFAMTANTPGLLDFDAAKEGQRYQLLVGSKSNLVLRATLKP